MNKKMSKKKMFDLIGIVIGITVIILGIIFVFTPAEGYLTYLPDDIKFGADFYTYEYEATRFAAVNAAATAEGISELSAKLALYSGSAFIVVGLLIVVFCLREYILSEVPCTSNQTSLFDSNEKEMEENNTFDDSTEQLQ